MVKSLQAAATGLDCLVPLARLSIEVPQTHRTLCGRAGVPHSLRGLQAPLMHLDHLIPVRFQVHPRQSGDVVGHEEAAL